MLILHCFGMQKHTRLAHPPLSPARCSDQQLRDFLQHRAYHGPSEPPKGRALCVRRPAVAAQAAGAPAVTPSREGEVRCRPTPWIAALPSQRALPHVLYLHR